MNETKCRHVHDGVLPAIGFVGGIDGAFYRRDAAQFQVVETDTADEAARIDDKAAARVGGVAS